VEKVLLSGYSKKTLNELALSPTAGQTSGTEANDSKPLHIIESTEYCETGTPKQAAMEYIERTVPTASANSTNNNSGNHSPSARPANQHHNSGTHGGNNRSNGASRNS
jgi:hypothetical protein